MPSSLEQRKLKKSQHKPRNALDDKKSTLSWKKKQEKREKIQRVRKLAKQLRDDLNEEQRKANESRKANAQRKVDNEKRTMVVQKISNIKAVRKLSPKHRKAARIFLLHEL
jgi:rRNA-processing protein CGR1